jgi:hypothetical protein
MTAQLHAPRPEGAQPLGGAQRLSMNELIERLELATLKLVAEAG